MRLSRSIAFVAAFASSSMVLTVALPESAPANRGPKESKAYRDLLFRKPIGALTPIKGEALVAMISGKLVRSRAASAHFRETFSTDGRWVLQAGGGVVAVERDGRWIQDVDGNIQINISEAYRKVYPPTFTRKFFRDSTGAIFMESRFDSDQILNVLIS